MRQPFTLEGLQALIIENGAVSVELLQERYPEWSRADLMARLSTWRTKGRITYTLQDGKLTDLEVLRIGRKRVEKTQTKGDLLRAWFYYGAVKRELVIAEDTASTKNQIQKADELITKHIGRIPTELLEIFVEELPEALEQLLATKKRLTPTK